MGLTTLEEEGAAESGQADTDDEESRPEDEY
jgi:hypothetical protein